jgi:putative transposase
MPSPRIVQQNKVPYFITMTTIEWLDIFTSDIYFGVLAKSLNYCIKKKGLVVYGYVFMTNHIHLILDVTDSNYPLESIIRDFKRHTTKFIYKYLKKDHRKYLHWVVLNTFSKKITNQKQIWKSGNWPIEINNDNIFYQKLEYIHNNPVKKGTVRSSNDWVYSSANIYDGEKDNPVNVTLWE